MTVNRSVWLLGLLIAFSVGLLALSSWFHLGQKRPRRQHLGRLHGGSSSEQGSHSGPLGTLGPPRDYTRVATGMPVMSSNDDKKHHTNTFRAADDRTDGNSVGGRQPEDDPRMVGESVRSVVESPRYRQMVAVQDNLRGALIIAHNAGKGVGARKNGRPLRHRLLGDDAESELDSTSARLTAEVKRLGGTNWWREATSDLLEWNNNVTDAGGDWSRATPCVSKRDPMRQTFNKLATGDNAADDADATPAAEIGLSASVVDDDGAASIADPSILGGWADPWPELRQWLACDAGLPDATLSPFGGRSLPARARQAGPTSPEPLQCTIPVVNAATLSRSAFNAVIRERLPVIFRGAVAGRFHSGSHSQQRHWRYHRSAIFSTDDFARDTFLRKFGAASFHPIRALPDAASENAPIPFSGPLSYDRFLSRTGDFRPWGEGRDNDPSPPLADAAGQGGTSLNPAVRTSRLRRHDRPVSFVTFFGGGENSDGTAREVTYYQDTAKDPSMDGLRSVMFAFTDTRASKFMTSGSGGSDDSGGTRRRRRPRNLIIGPAGAAAALHRHLATWHSVLFGVKWWFLLNPDHRVPSRPGESAATVRKQWASGKFRKHVALLRAAGFVDRRIGEEAAISSYWDAIDPDAWLNRAATETNVGMDDVTPATAGAYRFPDPVVRGALRDLCPSLTSPEARRRYHSAFQSQEDDAHRRPPGNPASSPSQEEEDSTTSVKASLTVAKVVDDILAFLTALRHMDGLEFVEIILPWLRRVQGWMVEALVCRRYFLGERAGGVSIDADGHDVEVVREVSRVAAASGLECLGQAGDLLYLPSDWWHLVMTVTEAVTLVQFEL